MLTRTFCAKTFVAILIYNNEKLEAFMILNYWKLLPKFHFVNCSILNAQYLLNGRMLDPYYGQMENY